MKREAVESRSERSAPAFDRYIGIDYSGAEIITSSRKCPLAPFDRNPGRRSQVSLSLRCSGFSCQIHPCRFALAALPSFEFARLRSFLALRWLGYPARKICSGGGLSRPLEPEFLPRRPHRRPARCLFNRRMASPCRSRWNPGRILQTWTARPDRDFIAW
jgi:hypothetical protein